MRYRFLPRWYYPDIFSIPYAKLKKQKIRYLIFDLDNTVGTIDEVVPNPKVQKLFQKLKKDFTIVIVSNNFKKRVATFSKELDLAYVALAMKPSLKGLQKIKRQFACQKEEMVLIGDQLVTDISAGNRFSIATILVDPIIDKEMKITSVNRRLEKNILKKYQKLGILERGKYDDPQKDM